MWYNLLYIDKSWLCIIRKFVAYCMNDTFVIMIKFSGMHFEKACGIFFQIMEIHPCSAYSFPQIYISRQLNWVQKSLVNLINSVTMIVGI